MSIQERIAEGSRLRREYNAARARNDKTEASEIRAQLEEFNNTRGDSGSASGSEAENKALKRPASEPSLSGLRREGSGSTLGWGGVAVKTEEGETSVLEEISKRNRQLNYENARRIQVLEAERRKNAVMERVKKEEEKKNAYVSLSFFPTLWDTMGLG
jgi:RNA polymerase-associated protein RTF1